MSLIRNPFRKLFRKKQPQPLPGVISFDLLKENLIKGDNRNEISYNDNVEISYKYNHYIITKSNEFDDFQIYSISITTKDAKYIYKASKSPNRLFYTEDVPDKIHIYLNIKNLNKPIIKINEKQILQKDIEVDKLEHGDALGNRERFRGGKKSRKRRSQKKKRKSQKSKKLRNQNKSKKRRSQKKKQRKTHRKRK